jgi:HPt (histidine-containing phosphotransfer) domain-containing protein
MQDDRITVSVDEGLSDLIPGFLTHKRADVTAILDAIAKQDYAQIGRIAHRIKGEGGSYGFDTMTELGRSLEASVIARDGTAATKLARKLLDYLDHIDVVFQPSDD